MLDIFNTTLTCTLCKKTLCSNQQHDPQIHTTYCVSRKPSAPSAAVSSLPYAPTRPPAAVLAVQLQTNKRYGCSPMTHAGHQSARCRTAGRPPQITGACSARNVSLLSPCLQQVGIGGQRMPCGDPGTVGHHPHPSPCRRPVLHQPCYMMASVPNVQPCTACMMRAPHPNPLWRTGVSQTPWHPTWQQVEERS
jgi:hypothetical protein